MTMARQIVEGIRVLDFLDSGRSQVGLLLERAKGEILEMDGF